MQAIIIGAGKVGFSLAEMLSDQEHDVIVVEQDPDRAETVNDNLDVQVLVGNGASPRFQQNLNLKEANLLVAVTDSDEVNMLACMFAKQRGADCTVARVRNVEYAQDALLKANKSLGIDFFINPEQVTANAITNYIQVPEALNVNFFDARQVMLLEIEVPEKAAIVNVMLKNLTGANRFLITSILRDGDLIIPNGDDIILAGDRLTLISRTEDMEAVEKSIGINRRPAEQVMILGGGRTGYYLAKNLEPTNIRVTIIEKNYARCERLSALLDTTIILHGDASDIDLLQEEGIDEVDILVSTTEDDKLNVLTCLMGSRLGAKKTIAQIRRSDYLPLIQSVGIDVSVSPRLLTSEAIMRFIQKGTLISMAEVNTGFAQIIELIIDRESHPLANQAIKDIKFPKGVIVVSILRDGQVIIPTGNDVLLFEDNLNIFVAKTSMKKLKRLFR
ncbi:Trk system potassium transporter TrkA [Peptococcus simiae]|uniref:Trk system potassium transporter TrkA n=1 Tax=Peptococcus simiae TaxID=1643805 RepID=UPI00397FD470